MGESTQDARPGRALELSDPDVWVVEPRNVGLVAQARDVWRYRYLFRFFAARALRKRYARTILGIGWLFIRPLFPVLIGTLVFGGVLGVQADVPFFLFLMVSMAHWRAFGSSLMWSTRSIEINRGMVKKLYFPRIILPIATMSPGLMDLIVYLLTIFVAAIYYQVTSGVWYLQMPPRLLWAVLSLVLTLWFALSLGLFTSILGAQTRDMRWSLRYIMNGWMLLTPVMYPVTMIPEQWRWMLALNPMVAFIEAFKFGMIGSGGVDLSGLAIASGLTAALFCVGLWFFNRAEATSADRL